jgi:hypothetical protein
VKDLDVFWWAWAALSQRTKLGFITLAGVVLIWPSQVLAYKLVVCAGMYRARSTWQFLIAGELVEQFANGQSIGYKQAYELAEQATSCANMVLKCHDRELKYAEMLASGEAVALYSYRDLFEVVESLADKRGITVMELYAREGVQEIIDNHSFWMKQPNVLVQRYEKIGQDPSGAVAEIASFLKIEIGSEALDKVEKKFSEENNLVRTKELEDSLRMSGHNLSDPENATLHDPKTGLHWNHIRTNREKDKPRGWRTMNIPQARQLRALVDEWNSANGYPRHFAPE